MPNPDWVLLLRLRVLDFAPPLAHVYIHVPRPTSNLTSDRASLLTDAPAPSDFPLDEPLIKILVVFVSRGPIRGAVFRIVTRASAIPALHHLAARRRIGLSFLSVH